MKPEREPCLSPAHVCEKSACIPRRCWPLTVLADAETFDGKNESRLIVVVLYQDRTAIHNNGLASGESFLHQKHVGLREIGSFADPANREAAAHTLV